MITMGKWSYNATQDIDCYEGVNLTIGKFCSIGSGLKIYSGTHPTIEYPKAVANYPFREQWQADYPESKMDGFVTIGNDVWIATDVRILEGVTIGSGAIVGAGSMVTKDVEPYTMVAGNPARLRSVRFEPNQIEKLLEISWWNFAEERIKEAISFMRDIDIFIERYG